MTTNLQILDIAFSGSGNGVDLERLSITFDSMGTGNSQFTGSFVFNANAVAVPEPASTAALAILSVGYCVRRRRQRRTT